MTSVQRQSISEVMDSLHTHLLIIRNNIEQKETLKELDEGLRGSLSKLADVLGETSMLFRNFYKHCGEEWQDEWDSTCDDECPKCGKPISPYKSQDIVGE